GWERAEPLPPLVLFHRWDQLVRSCSACAPVDALSRTDFERSLLDVLLLGLFGIGFFGLLGFFGLFRRAFGSCSIASCRGSGLAGGRAFASVVGDVPTAAFELHGGP